MHNRTSLVSLIVAGSVGFAGTFAVLAPEQTAALTRATVGQFGLAECAIKGNVSIGGGERIYHLPGQRYYEETTIRHKYGERYFCSEAEAIAADWRRSKV